MNNEPELLKMKTTEDKIENLKYQTEKKSRKYFKSS